MSSLEQFDGEKFVSATQAGYRDSGTKSSGAEDDKAVRRAHAKIHLFRYNHLPQPSRLAVCDVVSPNTCTDFAEHNKQYDKWSKDVQYSMFSCNARHWWGDWVSYEVTTFNTKAHIRNLQAEVKRLSFASLLAGDSDSGEAIKTGQHEVLAAAEDHRQIWERSIQTQIDKIEPELKEFSRNGKPWGAEGMRLQTLMTKLATDIQDIRSLASIGATLTGTEPITDLPPDSKYYQELTIAEIDEFWKERLTLEMACNTWNWYMDKVPIEENLNSPDMGRIMTETFCVAAHATWVHVMGPRLENTKEEQKNVYRAVRELAALRFQALPGIECIRVPPTGPNPFTMKGKKITKRPYEDDDDADADIGDLPLGMKRQRS
ncbi:MAG: hypothetical protein Q9166_004664 [cf. Caloplaca sp. 2 TL-2023]